MTREDGEEFRAVLTRAVREQSLEPEGAAQISCALLFSGGTDSLTLLWVLLQAGFRPACYTFRLRAVESADARAAAAACRRWEVPHEIVTEGEGSVEADVREVVKIIASARKTHVEVMYAYLHLMRAVREKHVWSGIQADTLYGSNKRSAIACGKSTAEQFARFRRKLLASPSQEGLAQAGAVAARCGRIFHAPYSHPLVREWFMRWSWADLNRPRQKMPALWGFAREFADCGLYRRDDNLQCGSGIREHMAEAFGGKQARAYKSMLKEAEFLWNA